MRARQWTQIAVLASAIGMTAPGIAIATDNKPMKSGDAATAPLGQTPATAGVGGNNRTMSFSPLNTWMDEHAASHQGRISREEFMSQMNQRWDTLDAQKRGYLTPDEARGIYSSPSEQAARPALSGNQVTPGNMKK